MTGLSGPAADLGLGAVMVAAQNKLLSAMPARLRASVEQMRARFHLDAPAWFAEAERPAHLQVVADAVWQQRPIRIRYRSWKAERERIVEPLGLVLKGSAWHLVGQAEGHARTYRTARILDLAVLDRHFDRPAVFDLEDYWRAGAQRPEAELHQNLATIRLSPWGVKMLEAFTSSFVRAATQIESEADAGGWRIAIVPVGPIREACVALRRFGAEAEVLGTAGAAY